MRLTARRALSLLQPHLLPVPVVRVLGLAAATRRILPPAGRRISGAGRAAIGRPAAIGGASGRRHAFPPPSPRRENTEPRGSAPPRSSRGLNAAGGFSRLGESGTGRLAHVGSNGGSSSSSSSAQPMLDSGGNALSSASAPQSCFAGCASAAPAASSSAAIGTGVRIDQALRTNVCARRFFESGRGVGGRTNCGSILRASPNVHTRPLPIGALRDRRGVSRSLKVLRVVCATSRARGRTHFAFPRSAAVQRPRRHVTHLRFLSRRKRNADSLTHARVRHAAGEKHRARRAPRHDPPAHRTRARFSEHRSSLGARRRDVGSPPRPAPSRRRGPGLDRPHEARVVPEIRVVTRGWPA